MTISSMASNPASAMVPNVRSSSHIQKLPVEQMTGIAGELEVTEADCTVQEVSGVRVPKARSDGSC